MGDTRTSSSVAMIASSHVRQVIISSGNTKMGIVSKLRAKIEAPEENRNDEGDENHMSS